MSRDNERVLLGYVKQPDGSFVLRADAATPTADGSFAATAALTGGEIATLENLLDKMKTFVDAASKSSISVVQLGGGGIDIQVQLVGKNAVAVLASDLTAPQRTAGQTFINAVLAVAATKPGA